MENYKQNKHLIQDNYSPTKMKLIQQTEEEVLLHGSGSKITFGNRDWEKNFDFSQTKENEELLNEINKIYTKSMSQSNLN